MRVRKWSLNFLLMAIVAVSVGVAACGAPSSEPQAAAAPGQSAPQEVGGQDEFGPYEPVANWPQPLPDGPDGVKHDGWTWGSVGAIFAETPDRIWIAQRGELPLPEKAKPWTPYALLTPSRGSATGNTDRSEEHTSELQSRLHLVCRLLLEQ